MQIVLFALLTFIVAAAPAAGSITRIAIEPAQSQSPVFDGRVFGPGGGVGPYEKLRGKAYGELDPDDPRNAVITDLKLAPRNARGRVEYSMDIFILKPVDLRRGNHKMFLDFNNRGEMRANVFNDAALTNDPRAAADAGTGFLMDLGYTIVGNGWDISATEGLTISVPTAKNPDGSSITGPSVPVHRLRHAKERALRTGVSGSDARQNQGGADGARAARRCPRGGAAGRLGIRRRARDPAAACGHAVHTEPHLRAHLHGEGSAGGRHRTRRNPRLHLVPAAREGRRARHAEPARGRCPLHVQLLDLPADAHAQRLCLIRLQPGRAGHARDRRHAQVGRRRKRRPDQLPVRPAGSHRAQPAESSLSGRHLPVRLSEDDGPPERQDGGTTGPVQRHEHVPEDLQRELVERGTG